MCTSKKILRKRVLLLMFYRGKTSTEEHYCKGDKEYQIRALAKDEH